MNKITTKSPLSAILSKEMAAARFFLLFLVLSLPFSSASALAATITLTKNEGEGHIDGFIDANRDIWTVEARIGEVEAVTPVEVKLAVTEAGTLSNFDTCVSNPPFGFLCTFQNDLPSGAEEDEYHFQVQYKPTGEAVSNIIRADGSAPSISLSRIEQNLERQVALQFTVSEQPGWGVGLGRIDIVDADSNGVLQQISGLGEARNKYNYKEDGGFDGLLQAPVSYYEGEGLRRIKVRATDRLGHEQTSEVRSFSVDFVPPTIINLSFVDLEPYVGALPRQADMIVYLEESSLLPGAHGAVEAFSDQVFFDRNQADRCEQIERDLQRCTWNAVDIEAETSLTITIRAKDTWNNPAERPFVLAFARDTTAPTIEFFGSSRTFQGDSYVKNGYNLIELRVQEEGAGIDHQGIQVNLGGIGGGNFLTPAETDCGQVGNIFACNWTVSASVSGADSDAEISVVQLTDKVGNEGLHSSAFLQVDLIAPILNHISLLSVSPHGVNEYYQSGDTLLFRLNVTDRSGLFFKAYLGEVVNDAALFYPASANHEVGWEVFTEEDCVLTGADWICEFETSHPLSSGHQRRVSVFLQLEDTPGNQLAVWKTVKKGEAQLQDTHEGEYSFEKLGLLEEPEPDYWEQQGAVSYEGFINIDLTTLAPLRVAARVPLTSRNAQVREIAIDSCVSADERALVQRAFLYGGIQEGIGRATPTVIVEFAPFNSREAFAAEIQRNEAIDVPVACNLRLFSQVGTDAVPFAELQEVQLKIPFGFTTLGGLDQGVQEKIKEARESAFTDFAEVMSIIGDVVEWIEEINNKVVRPLLFVFRGLTALDILLDPPQKAPPLYAIATGACFTDKALEFGVAKVVEYLLIPGEILSCSYGGKFGNLFTDAWRQTVENRLESYNGFGFAGKGEAGEEIWASELADVLTYLGKTPKSARGPQDNLLISAATLCIPGIVHNLEKATQIQCRYVYCLENEVAGGISIDVCSKMQDQMLCKYVFGEVFGFIPFFAPLFLIIDTIKGLFQDPIGTVLTVAWGLCVAQCPVSSGAAGVCSGITWGIYIAEEAMNIASTFENGIGESVTQDYCGLIDTEEEEEIPEAPSDIPGEEAAPEQQVI